MEQEVILYKGNLKNLQLENLLIRKVSEQIKKDFGNILEVKFNVELISEICNCIEEVVKSENLQKVDKLDLFFKIYAGIFGAIPEAEKKLVKEVIEYLHNNDKIKPRKLIRKAYLFIKSIILKKD